MQLTEIKFVRRAALIQIDRTFAFSFHLHSITIESTVGKDKTATVHAISFAVDVDNGVVSCNINIGIFFNIICFVKLNIFFALKLHTESKTIAEYADSLSAVFYIDCSIFNCGIGSQDTIAVIAPSRLIMRSHCRTAGKCTDYIAFIQIYFHITGFYRCTAISIANSSSKTTADHTGNNSLLAKSISCF